MIRRPSAHLAEYKTTTPRAPEQTLGHFHSVSLSLRLTALSSLYLALSSQPSTTERTRARGGVHGTAADPLAGVRAPQRVSASPSSGLAAVTPLPSPARSSSPALAKGRLGSSSPALAKGHPDAQRGRCTPSPFGFVLFFFLFFSSSFEWETRVRVRVRVPTLLFLFFFPNRI